MQVKKQRARAPAQAQSIHVVSFDDRQRVIMFFELLIVIEQRLATNAQKTKPDHKESSRSSESKRRASFVYSLYLFVTALSLLHRNQHHHNQQALIHMIDTIVLTLPKNMLEITKPELFKPSAKWVLSNHPHANFIQSKQNPSKKELLLGIYKPRLTLFNRKNLFGAPEITLKITLSLPKLMHGNNFMELRYKDFSALVHKLVTALETMGVATTVDAIINAPVSAVHYSKNIVLTDGSTPYHYVQKIKEANVHNALDVNQTQYRNDGHSYKWHCNSYEIAFYDKIRDLEKAMTSSKRALETDNELQMMLHNKLQKRRRKLEFLRMEVRLNKRQKMKSLFKRLNIAANLTFKKLFKPAISKKVLLYYMNLLESKRPLLIDYKPVNGKALFAALKHNNPTMRYKHILQLCGLKYVLESTTQRELRTMIGKCSNRAWYKLLAEANMVQLPITQRPFAPLIQQLQKFKPVRTISLLFLFLTLGF